MTQNILCTAINTISMGGGGGDYVIRRMNEKANFKQKYRVWQNMYLRKWTLDSILNFYWGWILFECMTIYSLHSTLCNANQTFGHILGTCPRCSKQTGSNLSNSLRKEIWYWNAKLEFQWPLNADKCHRLFYFSLKRGRLFTSKGAFIQTQHTDAVQNLPGMLLCRWEVNMSQQGWGTRWNSGVNPQWLPTPLC